MNNINIDGFNFINHNLQNSVFNQLMPVITNLGGFIFLFSCCIIAVIISKVLKKEYMFKLALMCLVCLLFCDLIALVLKYLINEPRPFNTLSNVNLLISEGDPYSFPSGHTTSTFSVVTYLVLNSKKFNWFLVSFAILIAFSRIYVGVHYPADVIAGAIIGICGAYFINKVKPLSL